MPSILSEVGFVSNPTEASVLKTDAARTKIAKAMSTGVINYFK